MVCEIKIPSPQPSPRSCLAGRGSQTGTVSRCAPGHYLRATGFDKRGRRVVLLRGMTNGSTTVSVKIPARILSRIPAPGNGRSRFIVHALEKEIERQRPAEWKPTTVRGRKLARLLEAGKAERGPRLNEEEFERELHERRGRNF